MKKLYSVFFISLILILGCQNQKEKIEDAKSAILKTIDSTEHILLKNAATLVINTQQADKLIDFYGIYINKFPKDSLSATLLLKKADLQTNVKKHREAVTSYTQFLNTFPKHPKTDMALFLTGFTYDNYLDKKDSAKYFYSKIINEYPQSQFADDAKALTENIGLSDMEIIRKFEKQNNR